MPDQDGKPKVRTDEMTARDEDDIVLQEVFGYEPKVTWKAHVRRKNMNRYVLTLFLMWFTFSDVDTKTVRELPKIEAWPPIEPASQIGILASFFEKRGDLIEDEFKPKNRYDKSKIQLKVALSGRVKKDDAPQKKRKNDKKKKEKAAKKAKKGASGKFLLY